MSNVNLSNAVSSKKKFNQFRGVEYLPLATNGSAGGGRGQADSTCCVKQRHKAVATQVVGGPVAATWAVGRPAAATRAAGVGLRVVLLHAAVLLQAATSSERWRPTSCSGVRAGGGKTLVKSSRHESSLPLMRSTSDGLHMNPLFLGDHV
jgi:hypothetical protein